ncbi:MAG TPA: sugar phosphate isomerase/epimerase family protein [Tepidisphaeraceae bacterium]|jgi:sugar phosphate isomerase/epimerase|nr:sugar phosphate isomerase/epimerase family protein [Tepidisphaeraceae bacterium]
MKFGISTSVEDSAAVKAAGWDFVEECVQTFLQGETPDAEWNGMERLGKSALPVPAANMLVPGSIKITGPQADLEKLRQYMTRVITRAAKTGTTMLVFGSAGARNVPDGFDRKKAREQILAFDRMSSDIAVKHGVTLVAEHLNRGESNIINTVAEAMEYVRAVNHPNFQCLVDSYHLWLENDSLENLRAAMPWIRHVHLADKDGRVPPGESRKSDYRPLFKVLKEANYDRLISVESPGWKITESDAARVLNFIKKQWQEA